MQILQAFYSNYNILSKKNFYLSILWKLFFIFSYFENKYLFYFIGPNCIQCIADIDNSKCSNCANDILIEGANPIYCDSTAEYHALVCFLNCRRKLFQSGRCNSISGLCECSSQAQTTTTTVNPVTTRPTTVSLFPVHLNTALALSFGFTLNERYVDMSNKNIGSIENTFLQSFKYVDTLILKNNVILKLYTNTFRNMKYLEILDLSYNKLTTLDPNTFDGAENLEFVYLNNNMLSSIDVNIFRNFIPLPQVNFSNNPIALRYNIRIDPITKILIFTLIPK